LPDESANPVPRNTEPVDIVVLGRSVPPCDNHKRSNVETTVMMIKTKFGDSVRSKTDVAMKNEVLCKILCHNLCCLISAFHELGIEAQFTAT